MLSKLHQTLHHYSLYKMAALRFVCSVMTLLLITLSMSQAVLDTHYYDQTCPQAEVIVSQTVRNASIYDPKVPARILRMFFHDCFIRGCDASILLDSTPENQAEKDGPPDISVRSFYVIDDAKSGGPSWNVQKGRKDGRVSKSSDTVNLPSPTFNVTQLIHAFATRGLAPKDLVALSGAHTLGFSHCSSFKYRLRKFSSTHYTDPTMNPDFANMLMKKCPNHNRDHTAGTFLDSTSIKFDNEYFKQLVKGRGVFGSDQALFVDGRTKGMVEGFAKDEGLFFKEFASSMVKLGSVGVVENGEVRRQCRVVN
ncbi:Peroxidase 66 [Linum perenne]